MKCVTSSGYLRYPHIHGDLLVFASEDDIWLAPADGGRAWRLSADSAPVSYPRFSRDGARIAWTSWRDGNPEVYTTDPDGNAAARLTYLSDARTRVAGWTGAGEVLAVSAAGQPQAYLTWAYVIPLEGAPPRRLPFGPVADLALEETGTALLTGRLNSEPAYWKRYRGGTRGRLWTASAGDPLFTRVLAGIDGQFSGPMLIGGRLFFLSDHEGTGNIYSCGLDGTGLRRHTDHDGMYARNPSTDGQRIVYHVAGDVWILDSAEAPEPRRLDIALGSPAAARSPRLVSARDHLGGLDCDRTGRASVVEVRGTVHWLTHKDGPARALHVDPAARARLPRVLGETGQVVWVTDVSGADALEIGSVTGEAETLIPRVLASGSLGYVMLLTASPDGATVAASARDGRGRGLRPGHRARHVRRRPDRGAVLVAGLGLAGLVRAGWPVTAADPDGPDRRCHDHRRDRRPVRRHQPRLHPRRALPGLPVPAQLRPGLRRAHVRPVVPVRRPPLPGAAGRVDPVAVRPGTRGPAAG
jgi:tricorn protease